MKSVEVIVSRTGGVKIEANGFAGQGCMAATDSLRRLLAPVGSDGSEVEAKAEMHMVEEEGTHLHATA